MKKLTTIIILAVTLWIYAGGFEARTPDATTEKQEMQDSVIAAPVAPPASSYCDGLIKLIKEKGAEKDGKYSVIMEGGAVQLETSSKKIHCVDKRTKTILIDEGLDGLASFPEDSASWDIWKVKDFPIIICPAGKEGKKYLTDRKTDTSPEEVMKAAAEYFTDLISPAPSESELMKKVDETRFSSDPETEASPKKKVADAKETLKKEKTEAEDSLEKEKSEVEALLTKEDSEAKETFDETVADAKETLKKEKTETEDSLEKEKSEVEALLTEEESEAKETFDETVADAQETLKKEKTETEDSLEKEKSEVEALLTEETSKAKAKELLEKKESDVMKKDIVGSK